jgi:Vacuolar sorting protein 9 (VPS9) domain
MITSEELANRKRARKALEQKRVRLEEAIERRLCEGIYDRIYRHRSTQDEAQDAKLRSKTAALALVGIGPADLGVDLGYGSTQTPEAASDKAEEIRQWLDQARKDLVLMNEKRYPLGKLHHLKAAHKSIVDTLAHFHPSSSADEIMPMLIYTLITQPPENLNVISDMHFIQFFRWEPKLTGEAAYCLTNLEAAISFLETVDLSTLRADEHPSGPPKSVPGTPRTETFPPAYAPGISVASISPAEATAGNATAIKPPPSPSGLIAAVQLRNRRLSDLINTPAQALSATGDAVFNTADQGLKNITNSLGESYNFLLGKLRNTPMDSSQNLTIPKTLDDARKLVSTPPLEDEGSVSGASSTHSPEDSRPVPREDKVLSLISGRKASRDHSADSTRSASSSKKVVFAEEPKEKAITPSPSPAPSNPALVESMRSLGNSLNPMARLSGISLVRGFGRTSSTPAAPQLKDAGRKHTEGGDLATVSAIERRELRHTSTDRNF